MPNALIIRNANIVTKPAAAPLDCPICDKPAEKAYQPFCSRRCADIDLGKWFNERYAVPTEELPGEEEREH